MNQHQHPRAFFLTVLWTLGLLLLGSVVHATGSSLACPDWPTCFGTMVPEMSGGVFWEHLHRLVAGGLILLFSAATYLAFREPPRFPWVRGWALAGIGLLLVQAALGGITVLFRLPDAVSTSHLGLAFLFLALVTALSTVTASSWETGTGPHPEAAASLRRAALAAATLTFLQSLVGAAVRHTDAGMACPDVPLCLGKWIPPFSHGLVTLHFSHRVLGFLVLGAVLLTGHLAFWRGQSLRFRRIGVAVSLVAGAQVLLGFLSVHYRLAVVPVSLHTLLAATLLTLLVVLACSTWAPGPIGEEGQGHTESERLERADSGAPGGKAEPLSPGRP
jgi:heme A synthase